MGRVQTGRHDGLIRRLFSIKGSGSLMAETLGDAFPVLQLEGGPIELHKLAGWELGMGGATTTSAVGETNACQLLNPAGSGKIVIPTGMHINMGASGTAFLGVTDVVLAVATVGRQRDTREGILAQTAAIIRHGVDATPPVGAVRIRVEGATAQFFEDQEGLAVLAPGTALTFVSTATNVLLNSGFFWRERTAESSELNF